MKAPFVMPGIVRQIVGSIKVIWTAGLTPKAKSNAIVMMVGCLIPASLMKMTHPAGL
jgi:hypothetical protein